MSSLDDEFEEWYVTHPDYYSDAPDVKDIKNVKRHWLYDNFGNEYYKIMFLAPEILSKTILHSDKAFELLLLGITFPIMLTARDAPQSPLVGSGAKGIEELVSEMMKLLKTPEYNTLPEVEKLEFLNRISSLLQLKENLESKIQV
jgi:hypothetical protein